MRGVTPGQTPTISWSAQVRLHRGAFVRPPSADSRQLSNVARGLWPVGVGLDELRDRCRSAVAVAVFVAVDDNRGPSPLAVGVDVDVELAVAVQPSPRT